MHIKNDQLALIGSRLQASCPAALWAHSEIRSFGYSLLLILLLLLKNKQTKTKFLNACSISVFDFFFLKQELRFNFKDGQTIFLKFRNTWRNVRTKKGWTLCDATQPPPTKSIRVMPLGWLRLPESETDSWSDYTQQGYAGSLCSGPVCRKKE